MAIESPLFQTAMELLGHSISHFNTGEELDRKLVILHLANALELLLKDLILDTGESIYKNPKETLTIHGCIQTLKDKSVSLPYLNKIELLIDERNALQHRFGSPNELTTIFYMNISIAFFKEVLKEHYGLDFDEVLSQFVSEKDLISFRMREPTDESELENLKKLAKVHPLGTLLSAMTYLEKVIYQFASKVGFEREVRIRPYWAFMSHRFLERFGIVLPEELGQELDEIRRLRNMAAHGRRDPTKQEVIKAIQTIEKFEKFLSNLNVEVIKRRVEELLPKKRTKREERLTSQMQPTTNSGG